MVLAAQDSSMSKSACASPAGGPDAISASANRHNSSASRSVTKSDTATREQHEEQAPSISADPTGFQRHSHKLNALELVVCAAFTSFPAQGIGAENTCDLAAAKGTDRCHFMSYPQVH